MSDLVVAPAGTDFPVELEVPADAPCCSPWAAWSEWP